MGFSSIPHQRPGSIKTWLGRTRPPLLLLCDDGNPFDPESSGKSIMLMALFYPSSFSGYRQPKMNAEDFEAMYNNSTGGGVEPEQQQLGRADPRQHVQSQSSNNRRHKHVSFFFSFLLRAGRKAFWWTARPGPKNISTPYF